ncbi:MAG: hypothetical protein IJ632_08100 [Muribaculaceae bacterium]|nr:hypothetical protein [Muribaculaceae bacterium]
MKHLVIILCLALACVSCQNTDTVNILISNVGTADCHNATVTVPMSEVMQRLNTTPADTLILLNERNTAVEYSYTPDREAITFTVPIVKFRSQKNYTLNKGNKRLRDNLLRFRTANITVTVQ